MTQTKQYIATNRKVNATPMTRKEYNDLRGWDLPDDELGSDEGYLIEEKEGMANHKDYAGYITWLPKQKFNEVYRPDLGRQLNFGGANKITEDFLESQITRVDYIQHGTRRTFCVLTVANGFDTTGESVCVDEKNFNAEKGKEIAYKNAFEKLWIVYGFALRQHLYEIGQVGLSVTKEEATNQAEPMENQGLVDFGQAIKALKAGKKVTRKGWNGKGMFVYYVPANTYPAARNTLKTIKGEFENDLVPYREYLALKTAQGDVATWAPSVSDALAEDWIVV